MLSNPMLGVAIGLTFMYLMLSIVVTVLQEFIASTLKLRNKNLQNALIELLGHENKRRFFAHPLIFPLFRGGLDEQGEPKEGGPSYIPKRNFALAVLDLEARGEAETDPSTQRPSPAFALARFFEDTESGIGLSTRLAKLDDTGNNVIANITNDTVKTAATSALTAAVGELKTATDLVGSAVNELETLFDSTMNRASGWFKVNAQRIAFAIGLVVAVVLNVDTIYVGRQLWANDDLRAAAVAAAESYYTTSEGQRQLTALCVAEATGEPPPQTPTEGTDASLGFSSGDWQEVKDCTEREILEATSELVEVGYPIGWTGWNGVLPTGQPDQNFVWSLIGFLITGLALSLGASFWFDLLGKFMNVRMTGKKEATASPDSASQV